MIYRQTRPHFRIGIFAAPYFDTANRVIYLRLHQIFEAENEAGEWETVPGSMQYLKEIAISNQQSIYAATGVLAASDAPPDGGQVGAFDYFAGMSAAQLGLADLDGLVYPAIAATIENFLELNNFI